MGKQEELLKILLDNKKISKEKFESILKIIKSKTANLEDVLIREKAIKDGD